MKKRTVKNLATVFGLGEMPVAPGTFGTLGGIPLYIGLVMLKKIFPNNMIYNSFYFMFLMTFFAVAVYVSDIAEREIYKEKDPQAVVIDEVLGFLTTLFLINPVGIFQTSMAIIIGFVIFRFFDITKIGPIYKSQFFGNGIGVVLDDFLAGVIGNFLMVCIWTIFF
ncbi:phosphatidylglycerophosphatase A [Cetobacterium sp. 8H]|uniref:phosphatidylglycerophosphatase A family protein n=1 Tax=Cetobacterium sp. 8H TaxID=2759681 RepID=UPI00163D1969|nr:phosphatidylglycerophosphatase A [Cetobacterium sp. 8H]MBC2851199.1 phosphatidylglycerophosphatase A [Cetobacterium sp. 8H]